MKYKPISRGMEFFDQLIEKNCYYVDKTLLIKELLDRPDQVTVFTRPRRFGKTLTLTMLKCFFEDVRDENGNLVDRRNLFDGLKIMDAGEEYTGHIGQYPVIFLTLKGMKFPSFTQGFSKLQRDILDEYRRHSYVLKSEKLNSELKEAFNSVYSVKSNWQRREELMLSDEDEKKALRADVDRFADSLRILSECLKAYHGKGTIILMDEYDVPLENAWHEGFYNEMVGFIRSFFETTFKTNAALEKAVITGCLRISKESIFTGMNNLYVNSVLDKNYGEYIGFTDAEIKQMCEYYDLDDKYPEVKDWYNGYYFGQANVYNPWSTMYYVADHVDEHDKLPVPYWANTSGNAIVRTLIDRAGREVKDEIEVLISGGSIEKPVHEDITYDEIDGDKAIDNLWNFMLFTGYLKKTNERIEGEQRYFTLEIPNKEVLYIFKNKVKEWFDDRLKQRNAEPLYVAIRGKDADALRRELRDMLYTSISYFDYYENFHQGEMLTSDFKRRNPCDRFYHGFLAGVLYGMDRYTVKSNRESGTGRTDLYIKPAYREEPCYIFEFKVSKKYTDLQADASKALQQIHDKAYDTELLDDGYENIVYYGVSFYGKDCYVMVEE